MAVDPERKSQCLQLAHESPHLLDQQLWDENYQKKREILKWLAELYDIIAFDEETLLEKIKIKTRWLYGESKEYKLARDLLKQVGTNEERTASDSFTDYHHRKNYPEGSKRSAYSSLALAFVSVQEVTPEKTKTIDLQPLMYNERTHKKRVVNELCRISSTIIPNLFSRSSYFEKEINKLMNRNTLPVSAVMMIVLLTWYKNERKKKFPNDFWRKYDLLVGDLSSGILSDYSFLVDKSYKNDEQKEKNSLKKLVSALSPLMKDSAQHQQVRGAYHFSDKISSFSGAQHKVCGFHSDVLNSENMTKKDLDTLLPENKVPEKIAKPLWEISPSKAFYYNVSYLLNFYYSLTGDLLLKKELIALILDILRYPSGVREGESNLWQDVLKHLPKSASIKFLTQEAFSTLSYSAEKQQAVSDFVESLKKMTANGITSLPVSHCNQNQKGESQNSYKENQKLWCDT